MNLSTPHDVDGLLKQKKGIQSVPDSFCTDTYSASDKCPTPNSGLATLD